MRLSLQQKEQFFHELSELIRSGRTLPEALEVIAASRSAGLRQVAATMVRTGRGSDVATYFAGVPGVFIPLDEELVVGGAQSGRLDEALAYLSEYYATLVRTRRRIVSSVLYPFFLLHFGAVMLALPAAVANGAGAFLAQTLGFLAIFYVLFGGILVLARVALAAAARNPAVDAFLQSVPGLGGARIAFVGSRFCMLMGMLVKAGGSILPAMSRAGEASGSARFAEGARRAVNEIRGGESLGTAVARTRAFPEAVDRAFQIGETSGRLDEEMTRQAGRFTEQFDTRLRALAGFCGKSVGVIIMLALAWRIVSFYRDQFSMMNSLIDSM